MPSSPMSRGAAVALVLAGAGLACALYTPWASRPFDILDFSEFLPMLRGETGLFSRYLKLADYYLHEHGRLNIVSYAALAAKWSILGDTPMLWHWLRTLQMSALVAAVYVLARRLDASVIGAAAGAALFISSRTAEEAWIRLTMGEPLGLGLMLSAALVITSDRPAFRSGIRVVLAVSGLVAAAILAKEMLVGWVPMVLLLAVCYRGGRLGRPVWDERSRYLVIGIGAVAAATMLAVVFAAANGNTNSLTASYRFQALTLPRFIVLWDRMVMPANAFGHPSLWFHPANLAFALTSLAGLAVAFSRPETRRQAVLLAAAAVGLPTIGALLYLPWPYFNPFYALPFMIGPALVLATAVTALERHAPRLKWIGYVGATAVALFAAFPSAYVARATIGHQQVNGELAALLPRYAQADSIAVAQPFKPQQKWQGPGPTLVRYAIGTGVAAVLPPAVDVTCDESRAFFDNRRGNTLLISYTFYCGDVPGATHRIRRYFRYVDYTSFSVPLDSVGADVLAPVVVNRR